MTRPSRLHAIIDEDAARRAGWTVLDLTDAFLVAGVRFIQLRCKQMPSGALVELARDVVGRAHRAGATVVVNDRADVALLAGADGVHLGQDDLDPAAARRLLGPQAIIGRSTHSNEQLRAAATLPATYVATGPVFTTASKETGYAALGLERVREAANEIAALGTGWPLVAIGGITLDTAGEVIAAGASSVAVIADLLSTGDPVRRARAYLDRLDATLE